MFCRERQSGRDPAGRSGHPPDVVPSPESGPHRTAERAEALRILYAMLERLDENKREVFILAELEQMPPAEIAEAIGIQITTVHGRLREARRALQGFAEQYRLQERRGR